MHRGAEPDEMVGTVLFLCSDAAPYVTAQPFVVDGGHMIRGLVPVGSGVYERAQDATRQATKQP